MRSSVIDDGYIKKRDAESALLALRKGYRKAEEKCAVGACVLEIQDLPTVDAVEVVRCKDCLYEKICLYDNIYEAEACRCFKDRELFVELPCKVGDEVWCIKRCSKGYLILNGRVNELYFTEGMQLGISVYRITKGRWGKNIFATREEAEAAVEKLLEDQND